MTSPERVDPRRVVVVGASGFGRECLDVLEAMVESGSAIEVAGVVDDDPSTENLRRLSDRGLAHVGSVDDFMEAGDTSVEYVLGVGSPRMRRLLVERLEAGGFAAFAAIHPSALVGSVPAFGDGVVLCAGVVVSTNVRLGRHVHVNPNATIGHDAELLDYVSVNPSAVISGDVVVESGTLVGANATILQGLRVGQGAVIGAASVVTRDVPGAVVVMGVPGVWR